MWQERVPYADSTEGTVVSFMKVLPTGKSGREALSRNTVGSKNHHKKIVIGI